MEEYNGALILIANRSRRAALACLLTGIVALTTPAVAAEAVTVLAAASLTNVLGEIGPAYTAESGQAVRFSFGSSLTLARQIEAGAQADVFLSADQESMDYLQSRGLVRSGTRRDLLGNRLVIIAASTSPVALRIAPGFGLRAALGSGRLSVGDPDFVPAGRYARTALTSLGVWGEVVDRLAKADNVRAAMLFVSRGEAPLGIVYETDARADKNVRVVDMFPANSHLPIVYPVAQTRDAGPQASAFEEYLSGAKAAGMFRQAGFSIVGVSR